MTLSESVSAVVGTPGEAVTHWGIARRVADKWTRLDYPDARGVRVKEWPLADLELEQVRRQWGAGEFRVIWFEHNPDHADPSERRRAGGNGTPFVLDAAPDEDDAPAPVVAHDPTASALDFAVRLMAMTDSRAQAQLQAMAQLVGVSRPVGAAPADDAASMLRAELAEMRARLDAERREREREDAHRAELARRDAEIAELRRQVEALENEEPEAPAESRAPIFEPGVPLLEQAGYALANGLARLAVDKPEMAAALLSAAAEKFGKKSEPPPPPPPPPAPRAAAPALHGAHAPAVPPAPRAPRAVAETVPPASEAWGPVGVPVVAANGEARPAVRAQEMPPSAPAVPS